MNKYEKKLWNTLDAAGAKLVRANRHQIFRLPDGRNFVYPSTSSDWRIARNALSDLNRLLDRRSVLVAPKYEEIIAHQAAVMARRHVPNRDPRTESRVVIPALGPSSKAAPVLKRAERFPIYWVAELMAAADYATDFWKLDAFGRVRVLMKLSADFRFSTPEVVGVRYCKVPKEETERWKIESLLNHSDEADDSMRLYSNRHCGPWEPAILFDDGESGMTLETTSPERLAGKKCLTVHDANYQSSCFAVVYGQSKGWLSVDGSEDEHVLFHFLRTSEMRKRGIRFDATEHWTDSRLTRAALREMRTVHVINCLAYDPRYDYKESEEGEDEPEARPNPFAASRLWQLHDMLRKAIEDAEDRYADAHDLDQDDMEMNRLDMVAIVERMRDKNALDACLEAKGTFFRQDDDDQREPHLTSSIHIQWANETVHAELIPDGGCEHRDETGDFFRPVNTQYADLNLV